MTTVQHDVANELCSRIDSASISEFRGQVRIGVDAAELLETVQWLKYEREFDMLVDVTCVE